MTDFKHIDSTAYGDDFPVDSFLLRRTHENLKSVREHRGRMANWNTGTLNTSSGAVVKPQVSGYGQRSLIPFLWHLSPSVSEIKVAVRHRVTTLNAASGYEVRLSAFAVEVSHFLSGRPLPDGQTSDLSGGASSSSTTTLTLDVSGLSKGWIVVCVGVLSGEAAAVEIEKSNGTHGPEVYSGYTSFFHTCDHNADLGTAPVVINHWGLIVQNAAGTKGSDSVGSRMLLSYEYDNSSSLSTDLTYRLNVYPPFPSNRSFVNNVASADQSLWYVPLGVLDCEGVTIYDSSVSHPPVRAALDASRAAGTTLVSRVTEQHDVWLENTRIHHLGPSQNPNSAEVDFTGSQPVNVLSGSTSLTNTYRDLCSCVVGRDDLFETGGTNYRRFVYTRRALVIATYPTQDPGPPVPFDFTLKMSLTDPNLSNEVSQTLLVERFPCIRSPNMRHAFGAQTIGAYGNTQGNRYDSLAYLLGFGPNYNMAGFERHTLRGVLPETDMGRMNIFDVEMEIEDSESLITRRILTFQAKRNNRTSDNGAIRITGQAPRLHVVTWSVVTTPEDEEVSPSTLGI